ncbi:MAG: GNAT family N-acetyltransferase [Clostridiales bacterium]|nr:GNAT family N-acetyltransferase [Clostridiales bacterium]
MTIRPMKIEDYNDVYSLWLSCPGIGLNDVDDSQEGIKRFLVRNPDTCFVAIENNEIVGVIMSGNDGRRGFIYHTAVAPDYRHRGFATQLVNAAMSALKRIGITKVALVVFERNTNRNLFWETQGFTVRNDIIYRNKAIVKMERYDT